MTADPRRGRGPAAAATPTRSPPRRAPAIARALFLRAVRLLPAGSLTVVLPDGRTAVGGGGRGAPAMTGPIARTSSTASARDGQDRVRRGVHGRRLGGRTTWPAVLAAFAAAIDRLAAGAVAADRPRDRAGGMPAHEENTLQRRGAQHLPPLRPLERALRALPRRDDDVLVRGVRARRHARDRAAAQVRGAAAELADVRPRQHVLEIGTGWGGMAIRAAATRGCRVTTATISQAQAALARERVAAAGLGDRVDVVLRDYRAIEGTYDRSSRSRCSRRSARVLAEFFATCDRLLGRAARSACRRSRCRTAGTWRPGAPTGGSTSTSSPAA